MLNGDGPGILNMSLLHMGAGSRRGRWRKFHLAGLGVMLAGGLWAQAPMPMMAPTTSNKLIMREYFPPGSGVPVALVTRLEKLLASQARADAMSVAATYARSDPQKLPGVQKLGMQLMEELGKPGPGFDFPGLVSYNPAFWLAERELDPRDVSLPYLVSTLAILNRNYVTAARTIALAQATLPFTATVRRGYGQHEAMLLYLDDLLLAGIPSASQMETIAQCDATIKTLRARIVQWSNRPGLLRALIELEARRVELLTRTGRSRELLDKRIGDLLDVTPEDLKFVRYDDPILATALDATIGQWLGGTTLAQRWSRWIEYGDPAEGREVEASVAAFEAHGRPDLAWLAWRDELVLRGFANEQELRRWQVWCRKLLNEPSAAYVEKVTAANPMGTTASMPIEQEGFSEAWSGDQRINPLLAVRIERQIALVDTMLALMPPGTSGEGGYRLRRAELLCEIDAVPPARRELQRVLQIIGGSERIYAMSGVSVMESIKIIEVRLLDTERHYAAAEQLYRDLLRNSRLGSAGLKINYAVHLVMAGKLAEAHLEYRAYALSHKNDTYRAIMSDLTARRIGQREVQVLRAGQQTVAPGAWSANGLRYFLDELSTEELLQRARQGTTMEISDHECEATFWIAERALAEGRKDDAITWLNRCVATGYMSDSEFKMAKAELERLVPKSDPNEKKSGPENSNGSVTT